MKWEVFNTRDGKPIARFRFRFMAWLVSQLTGLDYEREGEGWL